MGALSNGKPVITVGTMVQLIFAAVAGVAGTMGYQNVYPPRADPFTGAEGEAIRAIDRAMEKRIDNLETRCGITSQRLADHINVTHGARTGR